MANAHEIASRLSAEQRQALLQLGSDAEGDPVATELIDSLEGLGSRLPTVGRPGGYH